VAQDSHISDAALAGTRPVLRVLVLASQAQRDDIRRSLAALTELQLEISEADISAPPAPRAQPVDVVIFEFDNEHKLPASYTAVAELGGERPMRIALLRERASHTIREALRAGADEVLFVPADHGDLARALLKISETRKLHQSTTVAKLISMVSVTGGAGVTTTAANCALALAHSEKKKVALLDLDFQAGDLAVALILEPEQTIMNLVAPGVRLNSVQVEAALTKHSSGTYLLAAPRRIEESEQIHSAQVGEILDLMRQMVDVVIVDCGRHINDVSVAAWERSDELIYVIDQSFAAMRGVWRFLDLFGRLNLTGSQPEFVLNRWQAHHPITEKHILDTLGRKLLARIPRDEPSLEHALTRGVDLFKAAARSPLVCSYEALARAISGIERHAHKRGLLARIFTRNGAQAHPRS
jgi:pilus assembly protein CpaE